MPSVLPRGLTCNIYKYVSLPDPSTSVLVLAMESMRCFHNCSRWSGRIDYCSDMMMSLDSVALRVVERSPCGGRRLELALLWRWHWLLLLHSLLDEPPSTPSCVRGRSLFLALSHLHLRFSYSYCLLRSLIYACIIPLCDYFSIC